MEDFAS